MKNRRLMFTLITAALLLTGCSSAETSSTAPESTPAAATAETPTAPNEPNALTEEVIAEPTAEAPAADGSIYVDF